MTPRTLGEGPGGPGLPLLAASAGYARWWSNFWQIWWTRAAGERAVAAARRERCAALLRHARAHSPFYRELYRGQPADLAAAESLPVATKRALMARFDDWVTDQAIRRRGVDAFLADRTHIGERYLGRYIVWKSSGSTGEPGIYLQDDAALAVYDALVAVQLAAPDLAAGCAAGLFHGGRAALIAATGDHFASVASWERVCRSAPGLAAREFSVMEPLDLLVAELNAFAPAYLASYPTMLTLLAEERAAGRLRVAPALVWSGGEFLAEPARRDLERTFGCPVLNEYGTSECMSIAFGCSAGWLHVNADWVLLEPVDADYRPTAPGATSHTVLLTNLANRIQPVIRYDLGDAVVANPEPCRCGNSLPAIRVEGRRDDVITMAAAGGRSVRLLPLALTTIVEEAADVHRFQIVHTGGAKLLLRFETADARRRQEVFADAEQALRGYLARQGVAGARIALDAHPPATDLRSGKLRQVVVEPGHSRR
ncbi:MAG: phenylacetate--CoA ligase family protein [Betaproteobacteria bacterium]|nr:phenylacetate--CoA ligase family protein [Betaproteobacteria bacterium]